MLLRSILAVMQFNQAEEGVIDHIHVVGIYPFGNERLAVVTFYLFGAVKLHQNQVGVGTDAHTAPRLVVVVILGIHQLFRFGDILVVEGEGLFVGDVGGIGKAFRQLDQPDHTIINNGNEFRFNPFVNHAGPFYLEAPYAIGLNEYLVGNRLRAHDSPRRPVIFKFLAEKLPAERNNFVELLFSICHTLIHNLINVPQIYKKESNCKIQIGG